MLTREPRHKPDAWSTWKKKVKPAWVQPLAMIEWLLEWVAFILSNWRFLEVLEYLGTFSVLVAVVLYFHESESRIRQGHYQAWQVINTAQGKGGNGGRVDAMQQLNADHVSLAGIDVSGAFLHGVVLPGAHLLRSNFSAADARDSNFKSADFSNADLSSANFRNANLRDSMLRGASMDNADFSGADLSRSELSETSLLNTDLSFADLVDVHWQGIKTLRGANIYGVKNAPAGFQDWAKQHGAITTAPPNE